MSEQTANLCTTDACESLRARLAKYEDAEGRPVQPSMPDALAKVGAFLLGEGEIEGYGFGETPPLYPAFWWRKHLRTALESQAREIFRLSDRNCAVEDELARNLDYKVLCVELRKELAALKAQPSGVVLPERLEIADTSYGDSAYPHYAKGHNDALDEVARLNSPPVSAGEPKKCSYQDDPRSPSELSLAGCNCVRFGEGNPHWPCDLHAAKKEQADLVAVWRCRIAGGESYAYFPSKRCRFCEPLYTAEQEAWKAWQARAALAQSERVPEAVRDALARRCLWLAFCWNDHNFGPAHEEARKEASKHGIDSFEAANEWLAAAPSAGSQGGDV